MQHSPMPSTVGDSAPVQDKAIGEPFLDIAEHNQSAEEALQLVEDMGSQDRGKSASAVVSLAKYRKLAAPSDGAQAPSKETTYAKAVVQMVEDLLAARKN